MQTRHPHRHRHKLLGTLHLYGSRNNLLLRKLFNHPTGLGHPPRLPGIIRMVHLQYTRVRVEQKKRMLLRLRLPQLHQSYHSNQPSQSSRYSQFNPLLPLYQLHLLLLCQAGIRKE